MVDTCHYIIVQAQSVYAAATAAKSLQSCPTLCDPMDCSLLGSSIHGIFQARVLEWVAIAFSVISPQEGVMSDLVCYNPTACWAQSSQLMLEGIEGMNQGTLMITKFKNTGPRTYCEIFNIFKSLVMDITK